MQLSRKRTFIINFYVHRSNWEISTFTWFWLLLYCILMHYDFRYPNTGVLKFFLGWRQHYILAPKFAWHIAHIVVIDFKSPFFISNLEHTIIYFAVGKPRGWVQRAWVQLTFTSSLNHTLSSGTRSFVFDATVSWSGNNCVAIAPNQHPLHAHCFMDSRRRRGEREKSATAHWRVSKVGKLEYVWLGAFPQQLPAASKLVPNP